MLQGCFRHAFGSAHSSWGNSGNDLRHGFSLRKLILLPPSIHLRLKSVPQSGRLFHLNGCVRMYSCRRRRCGSFTASHSSGLSLITHTFCTRSMSAPLLPHSLHFEARDTSKIVKSSGSSDRSFHDRYPQSAALHRTITPNASTSRRDGGRKNESDDFGSIALAMQMIR